LREVKEARRGGTKFGYMITTGLTPILDDIKECGVDLLLGVDPVQGSCRPQSGEGKALIEAWRDICSYPYR